MLCDCDVSTTARYRYTHMRALLRRAVVMQGRRWDGHMDVHVRDGVSWDVGLLL